MKNIKINYLYLLLFLFILSCDKSEKDISEEPTVDIIDDYKLLAVSDLGEVFAIGNNTGIINAIGQIEKENSSTFLITNTLLASDQKIYSIEYVYNPSPSNNLLIFDRKNGTSEIIPLTLPSSIPGDERGIIALAWDNNNLIGILAENVLVNKSEKHIVSINLQDHSIIEKDITFNEDRISGMKKINSKLYISTWGEGFLEINLDNDSLNKWSSINGSRMAQINKSELAIMQSVSGSLNGTQPGLLNLASQSISNFSNSETYGLATVFGNTIYKDQVYLNLVSSNSMNLYLGILKTNFVSNMNSIVKINSTSVNRNLIIVDTFN